MQNLVKTSYSGDDVQILLKDLTGALPPLSTEEREKNIQSGTHYSEMLPLEYVPTAQYFDLYEKSLANNARKIALYTAVLAEKLLNIHGENMIIISLARAGIPIGILVKRYLKFKTGKDFPHYSISIIRGKGIDVNALEFIRSKHPNNIKHFQFLDGWTGKGAINNQLYEAVEDLKITDGIWSELDPELAVLADPCNICELCGTHDDVLIPSSCLNSTVSGLVSRTILRNDLIDIKHGDFHGAVYFKDLVQSDVSYEFIESVEYYFSKLDNYEFNMAYLNSREIEHKPGIEYLRAVQTHYDVQDINLIKPGIGETTRILLRRVPWKILINSSSRYDSDLDHIYRLCKEKNVEFERFGLGGYKCCGIIKNLSADA